MKIQFTKSISPSCLKAELVFLMSQKKIACLIPVNKAILLPFSYSCFGSFDRYAKGRNFILEMG